MPNLGFSEAIVTTLPGNNFVEDTPRMANAEKLITQYWQDEIARLEKITVPAYVVASYTNVLHTSGTFDGFRSISSTDKWLRVHNSSEWPDYYTTEHVKDLHKFFDHYLKGIENGWETTTPRVRLAVLNPGGDDELNVEASDWPLPDQQAKTLYLREDNILGDEEASSALNLTYSATGTDGVALVYTVPEDIVIVGYIKVRLWVEAAGSDDMDLSVTVQKVKADGTAYESTAGGESSSTISASNIQRVSLRYLDPELSTAFEPYHTFDRVELLSAGEVVPVEIGLWPTAMKFQAGELLQLKIAPATATSSEEDMGFGKAIVPIPADGGTFVSSTNVTLLELGGTSSPSYVNAQRIATSTTSNNGTHTIHFGGDYDSFVLLPVNSTGSSSNRHDEGNCVMS